MSQKKHRKNHSGGRPVSAPAAESEFASDGKRKRMNQTARSILIFTLVLLACVELAHQGGVITEEIYSVTGIIGLVLLLIALWFQFQNPAGGGRTSGGAPRLK